MKTFEEMAAIPAAEELEDLYEMANLPPSLTGLPFVVWISPKGNARHDVRIKVTKGPKSQPNLASVAIRPEIHVVEGTLDSRDFTLVKKWIELNRDVIIRFWDGDIQFTNHATDALKPIRSKR